MAWKCRRVYQSKQESMERRMTCHGEVGEGAEECVCGRVHVRRCGNTELFESVEV